MKTWLNIDRNSDFSIYNLPFGIYRDGSPGHHAGLAIGNKIVNLQGLHEEGFFNELDLPRDIFRKEYLNAFIKLGKPITTEVRKIAQSHLADPDSVLRESPKLFIDQDAVEMCMPVLVGDYTDFYSSIEHATNIGKMFRDPDNALLPNWRHLPVGYHGRASSIIISGVPIHRPKGQVLPAGADKPVYMQSRLLDFELEMAFIIGKDSQLGSSISTGEAEDYIFGLVLFNDWSARDIQKWEYVPLGPFLGKSFASSISPWIVTLEALQFVKTDGPRQDPSVLPYLQYKGPNNYDIQLEVNLKPQSGTETIICKSNIKYMYWNMAQQLAHHTVNGCNVRVGDMMASGTISGKEEDSFGSMLELSWAGKKPITLNDGTKRSFIKDYDIVSLRGFALRNEVRVGFGEVSAKVLPAL